MLNEVWAGYTSQPRFALQQITLELMPGLHLVLGPTGAGKSTLLRVMASLLRPARGSVIISGHDAAKAPLQTRAAIGYAPQAIGLPGEFTLREYLSELLRLEGAAPIEVDARCQEAARSVHLEAFLDRRLARFSGGMKRRALLAQAVLRRSPILLVDEPLSGLDPEEQSTVLELLRAKVDQGHTVLVATHIMPPLSRGQAVHLQKGRLEAVFALGHDGGLGAKSTPTTAVANQSCRPVLLRGDGIYQKIGRHVLLRHAVLSLRAGRTALLGPNGAGKTTLLRVLAGITTEHQGALLLDGAAASSVLLHRTVAYVPQFPGAHPQLTCLEHLERTALLAGLPRPLAAAREVLERAGLGDQAWSKGAALGAVLRRRLAIAQAWVRGARILLFDEPTADLDDAERARFWDSLTFFERDRGDVAIVVTTHVLDEAAAHCDDAVLMVDGRVIFCGAVDELALHAQGLVFELPVDMPLDPEAHVLSDLVQGGTRRVLLAAKAGAPSTTVHPVLQPTLMDGYLSRLAADRRA